MFTRKAVPGCPFCPANGQVDIIAENKTAYLVEAKGSEKPECYLIIPKAHVTDIRKLPVRWQQAVNELLAYVPWLYGDAAYNLSFNQGRAAGQRVPHVHAWVIPRDNEDLDSPAFELGISTVLGRLSTPANA